MFHAIRIFGRALRALPLVVLATTAIASAGIQVNKSFTPNSAALGATSLVTVTLQNDSVTSAATITAFSDDIGTTMQGHAQLLSSPSPATTCPGGTPTVSGQVLVMNDGQIPKAPSLSVQGSCTITFSVSASATGNGFNTIYAANVVTSLGSPSADVTQTLSVQNANVTATASSPGSVQIGDTSTVTYVISNPAAIALTNTAFGIAANASAGFTLNGYSTTCGGSASLPASGTSGTATFSGLTIPASSTCTVTLNVTTPTATTVNFTLAAGAVTDDQGATNGAGVSTQAKFVSGVPNITKSFNPTAVVRGGTTTLTINIQNVLTDKPLTNAALNDVLPASLTLASSPTAGAYCGTPTLGGSGTGTLTFSGGTIATNKTCVITATINVPVTQPIGSVTNTIPASGTGSFTSNEVNGSASAATATLLATGPGGGISTSKSAAPSSAGVNTPVKITLGFNSLAGGAFTGGTFVDSLPQSPVPMIALTDASHTPIFTNCGSSSPTVTFGGSGGNTTVSGSNLAIAAGGTCFVQFYVQFFAPTPVTRVDSNQLLASNVSFTGTSGTVFPSQTVAANISELPTLSVTNYVASNSGPINQQLTMQATVNDPSGTSDTNAIAVINLTPGKVALANTPNFTFGGCPAGLSAANIAIAGNREQFTVTIGSINATCTIGYDVIDELGAIGTFTPGNPTYSGTLTGNVAVASTGQNNVTFATTTINVTKSFAPNQIQSGGTATADIALSAPQAGSLPRTQVNGVGFNDALPANMTFSPTPNVTFGAGCQQTGQPTPTFSISGTIVTFGSISLLTVGSAQTVCDAKFDVTSTVVGAPLNQIAAGAITSSSGITNTQTAKASLTVNAGLGIAKIFTSSSFQIGGTDYVRFLITNSASSSTLSGGSLVDSMPAALVLASTVLGPQQTGDPALCGGSVSGPVGTGTLNLSGLSVAGKTGPANPGQCVVYVSIKASPTASPGTATNTVAAGNLNIGGYINQTPATAVVTLTAPPGPTIAKSFTPSAIAPGGTSSLSISIANTASGAADLSGMALGDTLPSGVTIAAVPNAATTCGAGTVTAVAGAGSVSLASGSVAAGTTCTITVSVTGTIAGSYVNTIPANALTTTQLATNAASASATLSISSIVLSKAFAPASIPAGGTSTLTITIPNGAVALTGMNLTDTLPSGVTIGGTPNAATTCGSGTVTAMAGGSSVALAGGTLAANATCTISVSVTASAAATYTNTISANALSTTQGVTNASAATANLTVTLADITLSKAFVPASIAAGGTSTLTITIPNTAAGSIALSGIALSDTLPSGVTIAATPNAATTCGAGTVTATAGGSSAALAGGTLAANATCTISANVTGTAAATYTNTIPSGALTTTQGVSNSVAATANLTITLSPITLSKAFAPATIAAGGTSALTITIPNTAIGSVALSNLALADALPSGVTIAATPNASTTCGAGTVTATAGGSSVALASGSLAANATCTLSVSVTGTAAATYTNTIPIGALTSTEGVSNAAAATANLTITLAPIALSKAFAPATIAAGGASTLTISVPNTAVGSVSLSNVTLTDALPAGVTIAATPNASTTCGAGTVTAVGGGSSVALAGGTLAANAICTISVSATGTTAATYTNTIPIGALTTTEGVSNAVAATANLTISLAPITLSKAFSPASIAAGGTSMLTITIPNTATGSIALSGVALSDTLPAGVTIAATPDASTTCSAGTVTAAAGGSSVALAGGSLAANATCTIAVNVTGTAAATYTNTIPIGALTTTQGVSNAAAATANLTITLAPITLSKAFSPATIAAGGTSTLTIMIPNTAVGSVSLSNMALSDALPSGVTIAATPNASTTCGAGTVTAVGGGSSVALAGGTLAANATCTISVSVTGTAAATYTNTIPIGALTTSEGVSNAVAATANLTISLAPITLSKVFAPATITAGGTSTLTISIPNTAPGAVALTGVALTDTLPAGVTIAGTPNATTTCGAGMVTASAGGSSVALAGGSLAANVTCTISVSVTGIAAATYTNTIPIGALATTQGVSNALAATANLTIALSPVTLSKAFSPATIAAGATSMLTITIPNTAVGSVSLSSMALTDALPSGVTIAATPNAATTCGAGTVAATAGGSSVALAGGSLAANATCTIAVSVTGTTASTYTNTIPIGALTTTEGVSNATAATADLTISLAPITLSKVFAPATITAGGTSTLTISIPNTAAGAVALTGVALTDTLPAGVTIGATPNTATTCASGTVSATAGGASVSLAGGTLAAGATCTVSVNVSGTVAATYTNTIPANALATTQGVTNASAATANLTINLSPIALSKAFAPATITAGGTSTLTITIPNLGAGSVALTGVGLTDTLPSGVTIAPIPSAATSCGAGTVAATAGGSNVALAGGALAAGATCTITVNVTGTAAASYTNTIPANALVTTQGVTNSSPASANLTINLASIALSKAFAPSVIQAGGSSTLTITIPNTGIGAVALSGMAISDTLPSGVTIAATPNASTTCPAGSVTATAGSSSVALAGGTLAANATCTISVNVTGTVASTYTNTIPASALATTQGVTNSSPATANLMINLASITLSKAFAPSVIQAGGSSTLTITIPNTGIGAVALSGMAISDTLPSGVTIAATPNAATTCPAGSVTATAGSSSVALAGGTLAANATCTITVSVTGTVAGTYTNTIPASALATTQGVTNSSPATANLTINLASIALSKAFAPSAISAGGTSKLTITIPNTAVGAVALTGMVITDTLPSGVTIAATPNAATTCPAGTVTATGGGSSVALTGGTLAANATCTITVSVTGTVAGTYTNTIPASALATTQGVTNSSPATANLTINLASIALSKAFAPSAISAGGTSKLTITIPNTAVGAVALTGMVITDTLPSGVTIAATPNAATTCPAGTVTATGGGSSVALTGGTLAANATCTITVSVTGTVAGTYTNTIPASALSTTQGVTNSSPATANLTINLASIALSKAFAPSAISAGGTSKLTITIPNTAVGAVALTGMVITDTLPSGVTIAATPNAATTCPAGTVTATGGGSSVALTGGTLAANATCTITVSVTGTVAATYTNTIPASALSTTQGVTNSSPATANLTINLASIALSKAFAPSSIAAGGTSKLTITIPNTGIGAVALTGIALTDTLPSGVTIAKLPKATTTCGAGTIVAIAGAATVSLAAGSVAANASCSLEVDITGTLAGTYTNTIPASGLVTTQGVTNGSPATADLTIRLDGIAVSKAFAPAAIVAGGVSQLTITIPNTANGAVALSGLALSDALPAGITIAATPNAATTCGAGAVAAAPGSTSVALTGGSLAADATCTIGVNVTGTLAAKYLNTIPGGALATRQGVTNKDAATATLAIGLAGITLSKAFAPSTIAAGSVSQLTISIPNTAPGSVALTGLALTDALPSGVAIAPTPGAVTSCGSGMVVASAGASSVSLTGGSVAANATCTVTVNVTAAAAGTYTNVIPANSLTSKQNVSNPVSATAALIVTAGGIALNVSKTSDVKGADVSAGQTIAYSVSIANGGTTTEKNAKIADVLVNASLVPGSVQINGVAASDAVVTGGASFGSIAGGTTVTVAYRAIVNANVTVGSQVTNSATVSGDQKCTGTGCTGTALPDAVRPPTLGVALLIDGITNETVTLGQVVTYSATIKNTGGIAAHNVTLSDTLPAGVTPIAGSVVAPLASSVAGQIVTAALGTLLPGASITITFRATIAAPISGVAENIVTINSSQIATVIASNTVVARMVRAVLTVTKTAGAAVVRSGDRVNYTVRVGLPAASRFGVTKIVDRLPDGMVYAPGSGRINGATDNPVVSGQDLTWTLPALDTQTTLTYAVAISASATPNTTLSNLVSVTGAGLGGGPPGSGSASASVRLVASAFGNCYPITGRVYDDTKQSGRFEEGDTGLAGVRVVLDDGESALTDSEGRYNFPCVRPGMHALRLDESTLPPGYVPYANRSIDSERSTRRLIHGIFDDTIVRDINFAITRRDR